MATWSDRLTHIRNTLEESTSGIWEDATLLEWYNQGQRDVAKRTKFREQLTTYTTGTVTATFARPSYDMQVTMVKRGQTRLTRETSFDRGAFTTGSGSPTSYMLLESSIVFYPRMASTSATVEYWSYRYPTPITVATNTVDLPDDMLHFPDSFVLAKAYRQIGDADLAAMYQSEYDNQLFELGVQKAQEKTGDYDYLPQTRW